ncbi:RNA-binding S4 domain-containing protein [Desulfolucanica intricata]|uniref:RNA-binding S4 domain-containing protein n=1 Tax=Desulfolucanica intricata TaxID=1285191 RepID=UPI00082A85E7|nr:RNA-binding S4 domain-containing protein [Desulfolucanica intricata]
MRLDKFLKVSRVIKRRTLAKEVCDRGQILLNGRTAKAGSVVKPGDILDINFGARRLKIRINLILASVPAKEADNMYEILEDIRQET